MTLGTNGVVVATLPCETSERRQRGKAAGPNRVRVNVGNSGWAAAVAAAAAGAALAPTNPASGPRSEVTRRASAEVTVQAVVATPT